MKKIIYLENLRTIRESVPEKQRPHFDLNYATREKSEAVAIVLSLCLGGLGIDRFYIGSIGIGILKFLTLGCFGILAIIDWFRIAGLTRAKNIEIATETKILFGSA